MIPTLFQVPYLGGIPHTCDGQQGLSAGWGFCAQRPIAPDSCSPILSSISPTDSSLPGALVTGLRLHHPPCAQLAGAGDELKGAPLLWGHCPGLLPCGV